MAGIPCMLPFKTPKAWMKWIHGEGGVLQGNHSAHTHHGSLAYAFDFKLRRGTQVLAARDGVVAAVCDHFREGGSSARLLPRANFVAVRHGDGTYSRYVHIMPGGALVKVGQEVEAGQPIALSGNTGFTTTPHLHFDLVDILPRETSALRVLFPGCRDIPSVAAIFSGPLTSRGEVVAPLLYLSSEVLQKHRVILGEKIPLEARFRAREVSVPGQRLFHNTSKASGSFPQAEIIVLVDRGGAKGEQTFAEAAAVASAIVAASMNSLCVGVIITNDRGGHELFAMAPPKHEDATSCSVSRAIRGDVVGARYSGAGVSGNGSGQDAVRDDYGFRCGKDHPFRPPRAMKVGEDGPRAPFPVVMISQEAGDGLKAALAGKSPLNAGDRDEEDEDGGEDGEGVEHGDGSRLVCSPPVASGYDASCRRRCCGGQQARGKEEEEASEGRGPSPPRRCVIVGLRAAKHCPVASFRPCPCSSTLGAAGFPGDGSGVSCIGRDRDGHNEGAGDGPRVHAKREKMKELGGRRAVKGCVDEEIDFAGASVAAASPTIKAWQKGRMLYMPRTLPVKFEHQEV